MKTDNRITSKVTLIDRDDPDSFPLAGFLDNHGEDFMWWRDGCVVVETLYDKKFRALGGDTNRLISFFEDYSTMHDAARHYIAAIKKEKNAKHKTSL